MRTYIHHPPLRSVEERNALVIANIGLVHSEVLKLMDYSVMARRLGRFQCVSIGTLTLIRVAELWTPSKGAFSTYAVPAIIKALRRTVPREATVVSIPFSAKRRTMKKRGRLLVDKAITTNRLRTTRVDGDEGDIPIDHRSDPRNSVTFDGEQWNIHPTLAALRRLRPEQRELVARVVLGGESQTDLAKELKINRETVGKQLKRALNRLRDMMSRGRFKDAL